ncbi:hypothetical protein SDC9_209294 [bioreactor metagenome]|uniref:Uncharacterized protein n=1 Tax=bioreactor metagenome TaxID=1076179 RepID=A0A645JDL4_9ZZZZ
MNKVFGFSYEDPIYTSPDEYFYFRRSSTEKATDIRGYDYLFNMESLYNKNGSQAKDLDAVYDYENSNLKISYLGSEVYKKDLDIFAKDLVNKYGMQRGENPLPDDEMILTEENDRIKVKIVFQNISGSLNNVSGNFSGKGFDFYLLVKVK